MGRFNHEAVAVDAQSLVLLRNGRALALTATSMRVLLYLVRSRGRLVSKNELTEAIWPNGRVAPNSLSQALWEIRRTVRKSPDDATTVIETVRSRGYRFLPTVERSDRVPSQLGNFPPTSLLDTPSLRALLAAHEHEPRVAVLARRIAALDPEDLLAVLEFVWLVRFTEASPPRPSASRSAS